MTGHPGAPDLRHGLLVVLLAVLLLLPALVQPSSLVYPSWTEFSDLTLIHWPKEVQLRDSLAGGEGWPLWSTYALSGQPLAANQLAMLFYPPALLLLVGPLPLAFSLFLALHLAWAGLGAYCLARVLGRRPQAALLAGAIFCLNGKLVAHTAIGHVSLVAALAWLPWALAGVHLAIERRSLPAALLAGLALAAQAATHTYALVFSAYGLAVYALLSLLLAPGPLPGRMRAVPRLALVPAVALLLGAAQLLPLLEMVPWSNRGLALAEATRFSLSPLQALAGVAFPSAYVGHEWVIYPGLAALVLAVAAWPRIWRERPPAIIALLVVAALLLALGSHTPLYGLVYNLLPGLRWVRTPARLWLFAGLGLAILAAYGLDAWQEAWRRPDRRGIRLGLVAAMGLCLALSLGAVLLDLPGRTVWAAGLCGCLAIALLLWGLWRRPSPRWTWLALFLVVADLLIFDATLWHPVAVEELLARDGQVAAWLAGQAGPFRVYSPSYSVRQPAASLAGLEQIDGVEPVHLADYDRFMALAGGYGHASFSVALPPFPETSPLDEAFHHAQPDPALLGLLHGRYLAAAFDLDVPGLVFREQVAGTRMYENELALPRAWVVHHVEVATGEEVWQRLGEAAGAANAAGTPLASWAVVEAGQPGAGQLLASPRRPSPAEVVVHTANRLVVETEIDTPGLLVLAETWYPGWEARDNGQPVAVERVNAILRGVYLAPGRHSVELVYRPWTVRAGLLISGGTSLALLLAAALAVSQRARRARNTGPAFSGEVQP